MSEVLPQEPDGLHQMLSLGYTVADPSFAPHSSSRHGYVKLEKDGELSFGKSRGNKYPPDKDGRRYSIQTDIWWCNTIAGLNEQEPLSIRTPQIIDYNIGHDTDWYIAQWIDGQPSAALDSDPSALDPFIPKYAEFLVRLDGVDPQHLHPAPHAPAGYLDLDYHFWEEWSAPALAQGFLKPNQVVAARQLVSDFKEHITPSLQHGDFTPWHVLVDKQQALWVVDGEHASLNKPRYFDLAYMYSRIFTYMHSPERAARLLQTFCELSGQDFADISPCLLPTMTSRAIGMHFDAIIDLKVNDYRAEAQDLLRRCLSRDPSQLLQ